MTVEERMDNLENMAYGNHKYASRGQGMLEQLSVVLVLLQVD